MSARGCITQPRALALMPIHPRLQLHPSQGVAQHMQRSMSRQEARTKETAPASHLSNGDGAAVGGKELHKRAAGVGLRRSRGHRSMSE
jgi:hypothetical protein